MAMLVVGRERRRLRIRRKVQGTSDRPRLSVFRSAKHIYAQLVDDVAGTTLAHATSVALEGDGKNKSELAKLVGASVAQQAKQKGITKIVFDRSGFKYHGRIQALAQAAREAGLIF